MIFLKVIATKEAPSAIGPYSQAIVSNGLVYASGQIPINAATGELSEGGVEEQTELIIKNLQAVLRAAGSDLAHVVKTTCFLTDMGDFAAFNEVYAKHFTGKPARSCVAVLALPKGACAEIEAVAEII
jgi:2-iminobutanoate/2-iminopropanoate deaminase